MKKLLTILCLVLLVSCSNEVPSDKLVERQGIVYEVNSTIQFTGSSVNYHENGQLRLKQNYNNGILNGPSEDFYENGQLKGKENYKNDEKDGLWEYFDKLGNLFKRMNYKNDIKDGLWEKYFSSGQLYEKGNYKNDIKDGLWEHWDYFNGKRYLVSVKDYKNGQKICTRSEFLTTYKNLMGQQLERLQTTRSEVREYYFLLLGQNEKRENDFLPRPPTRNLEMFRSAQERIDALVETKKAESAYDLISEIDRELKKLTQRYQLMPDHPLLLLCSESENTRNKTFEDIIFKYYGHTPTQETK